MVIAISSLLSTATAVFGPPDAWWTRGQKSLHWVVPFSIQYKVKKTDTQTKLLLYFIITFFLIYQNLRFSGGQYPRVFENHSKVSFNIASEASYV